MKCGVVSSSTLHKHGRWDAGFYFGHAKRERDRVKRAEDRVTEAKRSLQRAKETVAEEEKRVAALVESGEVKPIGA